jgi:Na+/proline symporter
VFSSSYANEYKSAAIQYDLLQEKKKDAAVQLSTAIKQNDEATISTSRNNIQQAETDGKKVRQQMKDLIKKADPNADTNDTNYIFLRFVGDVLPKGLIGLIIAIIFLAAWGSIAAALNSLASCTMIDFHKKFSNKELTDVEEYKWSKFYTFAWGIFSILIAFFAYNLGNSLIEAVNILGSWFYGTILGIFLVAFYIKKVGGNAVFIAAIISEIIVIGVYYLDIISFLWLNVIGTFAVILISVFIQILKSLKGSSFR